MFRAILRFIPFLVIFAHASIAIGDSSQAQFGSGALGTWITDAHGLPAFEVNVQEMRRYANGVSQPLHMLGNGNTTSFVHPDGYAQLFTNRTFPRFANALSLDELAYGGGFGYVQDGGKTWSTAGPDLPAGVSVTVIFGMGYMERAFTNGQLRVTQRIYPSATDESLIDEVTLTNLGPTARTVGYVAYWDVNWQFPSSFGPRRDVSPVAGFVDVSRRAIKIVSLSAKGNLAVPSLTKDPMPKVSYLVALNRSFESFETMQSAFFGNGKRSNPAEAVSGASLPNRLPPVFPRPTSRETVLVGRFQERIPVGGSVTLYTGYGISDSGAENAAIDRLQASYADTFSKRAAEFVGEIPQARLSSERWLERESAWNYYYLKAGRIREDYWSPGGLSILNQGSVYLYQLGQNASLRDPLQHAMPLMYLNPELARDTLLYALRNVTANGSLPYATSGYGAPDATLLNLQPSDMALWLIWSVSEYVFATRDTAFLEMPIRGRDDTRDTTVASLLKRAVHYQMNNVGYGAHGLIRILHSDWNDILIVGSGNPLASILNGESTLNTALAIYVYDRYSQLIASTDPELASRLNQTRASLRTALQAQWKGNYFNRAYVALTSSPQMNEVGNEALWLEANAFALLSGDVMTQEQLGRLLGALRSQLSDPSPNGMAIASAGIYPQFLTGLTYSSWYSINGTAIQGMLKRAHESPQALSLAWDEHRKNSLAVHAETYPTLWYGVFSGPDSYYNEIQRSNLQSGQVPGGTFMDGTNVIFQTLKYPTANLHAHGMNLLNTIRFSGIEADSTGYTIDPKFPFSDFSWSGPAVSVSYSAKEASGRIKVMGKTPFELTLTLPMDLKSRSSVTVTVNGTPMVFTPAGGKVRLTVFPDRSNVVNWAVR